MGVANKNAAMIESVWTLSLPGLKFDRQTNYFDLGKDSLHAITMLKKVQEVTEVEVPLSYFFSNPTIDGLTKYLVDDSMMNEADEYDQLIVPIANQKGTKTPIFFIHPARGSASPYFALAAKIAKGHPVYGIQAVGLSGVKEPLQSLELIAQNYYRAIKQRIGDKPFIVGGHSFGGNVASHVSMLSRFQGNPTPLLILFDPGTPQDVGNEFLNTDNPVYSARFLAWFSVILGQNNLPIITVDELKPLAEDERIPYIVEKAKSIGTLPEGFDDGDYLSMAKIWHGCSQALLNSSMISFDAATLYFEAAQGLCRSAIWQQYCEGEFEAISMDCNHIQILAQDFVGEIADSINGFLADNL
ncbi:alpha/beta fold hydrolase [Alteromonas stellipolaris]|uniref:thioesterase domain-containing protein n=1 Tax=Alteromonas stellipolaris TaxID=233316 RepID=UPI001E18A5DE|nr:alpha/beta fold hydrolase [Alteromonas stellipolaris]MBZ2163258.1 alpha/beta fold hydrolase [Alteromonas stellipolaris]